MRETLLNLCLLTLISLFAEAQPAVHSHNDYEQNIPFWNALSAGCSSIEADVFLENGSLLVAHNKEDLSSARSLEDLYLKPLQSCIVGNLYTFENNLQILIDQKTEGYATLKVLVATLQKYPSLINSERIKFVISGNRPKPEDYSHYPAFIHFDFQQSKVTPANLNKVALISLPFSAFSHWNGKGRLVEPEETKLKEIISYAHALGKPIRFWGTPDSPSAWYTFSHLGIDFINTDHPFQACQYVFSLPAREVGIPIETEQKQGDFDSVKRVPRSVILMIGDGNGLAQISAGLMAAKTETNLSRMKNLGLVNTRSADDQVTDSAAGGTAMATGKKTRNRYIGVDASGHKLESILDYTRKMNADVINGIITTDDITGATPSAFYAHVMDRDSSSKIAGQLEGSALDWFVAGGRNHFKGKKSSFTFFDSLPQKTVDFPAGVLAADKGLPFKADGRGEYLQNALAFTLEDFEKRSTPFFLMVENGHIDGAGHENDAMNLVNEELDFDAAIGLAMQFVDAHPEVLLVITADHETGGVSIPHGSEKSIELDFESNDHSGIRVPLFAYGNGAENFTGFMENTDVFHKIVQFYGFQP